MVVCVQNSMIPCAAPFCTKKVSNFTNALINDWQPCTNGCEGWFCQQCAGDWLSDDQQCTFCIAEDMDDDDDDESDGDDEEDDDVPLPPPPPQLLPPAPVVPSESSDEDGLKECYMCLYVFSTVHDDGDWLRCNHCHRYTCTGCSSVCDGDDDCVVCDNCFTPCDKCGRDAINCVPFVRRPTITPIGNPIEDTTDDDEDAVDYVGVCRSHARQCHSCGGQFCGNCIIGRKCTIPWCVEMENDVPVV